MFSIQNFIFTQIQPHLRELSRDLYGCRVIQCILEHGTGEHRSAIFNELFKDRLTLIDDHYGNYVIQHALRMFIEYFHFNRIINIKSSKFRVICFFLFLYRRILFTI